MKYVQHLNISNPVTQGVTVMQVFVLPDGKLVGLDEDGIKDADALYSPYAFATEIEEIIEA